MRTDIVITLTGPDRVGIVEEVTNALLGLGANVEESRMSRLGGAFAILMLVSLAADRAAEIDAALTPLTEQGYRHIVTETTREVDAARPGWQPYRIEVEGADHEGIIHEIAEELSSRGINIESMETRTTPAAVSGLLLFTMNALVIVPPHLADTDWLAALTEAAAQANVDIEVAAADL